MSRPTSDASTAGAPAALAGSTVLGRIVARTRADLATRKERRPFAELESVLEESRRSFADALAAPMSPPNLIAEFKLRSPSRGDIRPGATAESIVPLYARYAAAISVLCDEPHFGGGFDKLEAARRLCDLPLLCKDFIVDRYQIAEGRVAGADGVLLMASVLGDAELRELLAYTRSLGMEALVETHDDEELQRALDAGARVVGVNSRDLRTLEIDFDQMLRRLERVPDGCVRVAESGVSTPEHVASLAGVADAVLIGTTLMAAPDPAAKLEALGWTAR